MATRSKRTAKPAKPAKKSGKATTPAAKAPAPKGSRAKSGRTGAPGRSAGTALVIVESPTKAKTIGKYLGAGYDVKATIGHVRDLPTRELGVDVDNGFEPKYVTIKGKTKTLSDLKKAAKGASAIYLATDPDREGEAIAWHVAEQLDGRGSYPPHPVSRDHQGSHPGGAAPAGQDRRPEGGRPAGPPNPRPAGGLQGQPDSVAQHQDRPVGRPGSDRGAPAHRGA